MIETIQALHITGLDLLLAVGVAFVCASLAADTLRGSHV